MFLTAVILILFFSLSDLAKWMNQNGATDKQKLFVFGGIFVLIVVIVNLLAIAVDFSLSSSLFESFLLDEDLTTLLVEDE